MQEGREIENVVFLHHKDGHREKIRVKSIPIVKEMKTVGAIEVFSEITYGESLEEYFQRLKEQALIDELTGIGNRRFLSQSFQRVLSDLKDQTKLLVFCLLILTILGP